MGRPASNRPSSGFLLQLAHRQLGNQQPRDENGGSRLVSPKSPVMTFLNFYAQSAKLLLLACSCASSDSAGGVADQRRFIASRAIVVGF
jgi:hypothetical protein